MSSRVLVLYRRYLMKAFAACIDSLEHPTLDQDLCTYAYVIHTSA